LGKRKKDIIRFGQQGEKEMKIPELKITADVVMKFEFQQVMMKLVNTATDNKKACAIHHISKEVEKHVDQFKSEFKKDILEKYAQKDEHGKYLNDEGQYKIDPKCFADYKTATEAFGKKTAIVKWKPLTPSVLSDIKMSAKEIDLLGELFSEQEGPGLESINQSN
jgi:hypothetical protein